MSTHTEHAPDPKAEARGYVLTLTALLILTAITVGASYINFGPGNVVIALAIATIKASIVALFFMHLLHDKPVNGVIAVTGFLFLGIFLMFDFLDVDSRKDVQPINLHTPPAASAPAAPAGAAPASPAGAVPASPAGAAPVVPAGGAPVVPKSDKK
jgi:cytochrome c oxidase subunit 4